MRVHELYEHITQSIITDLENGLAPWTKPWKTGSGGGIMPVNAATTRPYSGINIPILWHAQQVHEYPTPQWMTYKQALPLDSHVRKGEQGTTVVFTKRLTVKAEEDEEKHIAMLRTYTVFNIAQIDGFAAAPEPLVKTVDDQTLKFIEATKADIRHGGNIACYVPSKDFVQLPNPVAFDSYEHYQATALHELAHWSGHQSRLNRDLGNRFGTKAYAAEEMVAELGAAFLCAHLGIKGELKHAEYLADWLRLLKEDNRAIFTASSKASQAADYLRSFSEAVEEDQDAQ
jgi:antirestriction protein ArdC